VTDDPPNSSDAETPEADRPASIEGLLAGLEGESDETVQALLKELAPIHTSDVEGRRQVHVRPTDAEAIPGPDFDPKTAHQARIDGQFIAAERMERWAVRAVWMGLLLFLLYFTL